MNTRVLSVVAALTLAGAASSPVHAQTLIYGLAATGNSLVSFSSVPVGGLIITSAPVAITNLGAGQNVVGIDFRPLDGLLYAVARDAANAGFVYTVNLTTGFATNIPVTGTFTISGLVAVDFNPAAGTGANAIRVETSTDINNRLTGFTTAGTPTSLTNNVDGNLTNPGDPTIIGTAYNNNTSGVPGGNGTGGTVQYAIDSVSNALYIQNSNVGSLTVVGTNLGINPFDTADGDLDIVTGTNRALATLSTDGTNYGLYDINLTTGTATLLGNFSGTQVRDLAAPIPEPTSAALFAGAAGLLGMMRRRTRN